MQRICHQCRRLKPVEAFTKGRVCDSCREVSKAYRAVYLATWRAANGARSSAAWRKRNPEYERERYRRGKEGHASQIEAAGHP